jgi:hypothetical protein
VLSTDGDIVTYITKDSGALYNVYDSDGTLLAHDRGTITERYVFDTLGDSQPGGEFLRCSWAPIRTPAASGWRSPNGRRMKLRGLGPVKSHHR